MYFYLKNTTTSKSTLIYLKYHIDKEQGRFVYSAGLNVSPADWDFKAKNILHKRGRTDLAAISRTLQKYDSQLNKLLTYYSLHSIKITRQQLKTDFDAEFKGITPPKAPSVTELLEEFIKDKETANILTLGTKKRYNNIKNTLIKFEEHKKIKLSYESFNKDGDFNTDWMNYCYNVLNHTDNTVGRSFGFIKTILRFGKIKGYHNLDLSHLKKFSQETDDIALTKPELMAYYDFDFEGNLKLEKARDIFCIGCFTGQRFSDYSVFNKSDYKNGNIEIRAKKTRNKSIIPVDANPKLKYLLEKYDWQIPKISQQKFRDYIKDGLEETECMDYKIKKISYRGSQKIETIMYKYKMVGSHTARRTFITLALEDGWTYKEIMTVAGIKEVATVIKYDKVNSERLNRKVKLTFG